MKVSIIYYTSKLNIKRNLLEEDVNFVDNTKKQTKYFKIMLFLIVIIIALNLFYLSFKYLIEKQFFFTTNTKNKQS